MQLTQDQKDLLDGSAGKGTSMAMRILVAIGDGFGADRLVPITRAHVALSAQEADNWFADKLCAAGARCVVPTSVNPGYCIKAFREMGAVTDATSQNMQKAAEAYRALGTQMNYCCTPYLYSNIPHRSEVVSFSESSATVYVNAVLGAYTNRESAASALCAAVTGYTPEYGMLLPKNRLGTVQIESDFQPEDPFDFALLGLAAADRLQNRIPVFTGLGKKPSTEMLIALGAQLNVTGICPLFHIPGITPEASTVSEAFGGHAPQEILTISQRDIEKLQKRNQCPPGTQIDFMMLGCPHYTVQQVLQVVNAAKERLAKFPVYVFTAAAVKKKLPNGTLDMLQNCGVTLLSDSCIDQPEAMWFLKGKIGLTDSFKCAYYPKAWGVTLYTERFETCMEAAFG
jgi:predicted aconitase